ncbi:actin-binding protein [Piedraia hortae CBS 480.64]|uniref:Coronin n=1 Tax=Piedraia hortae CBS 480.64 TaxID=1314780 RepID=A0A6A7C4G7_9PEZI|nr:actin-binding protein [Piedraia hortae CBS 480.64]
MSGRFVRASKYRHVFGRASKRDQSYDNLRISKNAWDTNLIKANPSYLSINWDAGGGGAFAVIPLAEKGRLPDQLPLFRGHTAAVLDTDFNPFNDSIIASASDDSKVFLWRVPDHFSLHTDADEPSHVAPVGKLSGHSRKVGHVLFNPAAENVLASSSGDFTVKIWDLESGKGTHSLPHQETIQSLSWSADGSTLVTTSRDKHLRFWDVRAQRPIHDVASHQSPKSSRCVWLGEQSRVATTGFSRMSERQLALWDPRAPNAPIGDFQLLDSGSGVVMPFFDSGSNMLYLAGKGDGNIRYFELENDKLEPLSEYKSPEPQRGIAFMPKRGVSVNENEVMRAYKTIGDGFVEVISFVVPRRAEGFQGDLFPPTVGLKPASGAQEWLEGHTGLPPKMDMEGLGEGGEPQFVDSTSAAGTGRKDDGPRMAAQPAAYARPPFGSTKASAEKPEPEPVASQHGMDKKSMSNAANKFADEAESSSEGEFEAPQPAFQKASSVTAPQQLTSQVQASVTAQPPRDARSSVTTNTEPTGATPSSANVSRSGSASGPTNGAPSTGTTGTTTASIAGGLREALHEMKELLISQSKQIADLKRDVEDLKASISHNRVEPQE